MTESPRQLPPQIKRVEMQRRADCRPVVRYQLVDLGVDDGKRKQFRTRYATEKEVRDALAGTRGAVTEGRYPRSGNWTHAKGDTIRDP